jgi:hypothetical protein
MIPVKVSLPGINLVSVAKASVLAFVGAKLKREGSPEARLLAPEHDEHLADDRDSLRPSEFVQRKLQSALHSYPVPVSAMHSKRFVLRP